MTIYLLGCIKVAVANNSIRVEAVACHSLGSRHSELAEVDRHPDTELACHGVYPLDAIANPVIVLEARRFLDVPVDGYLMVIVITDASILCFK